MVELFMKRNLCFVFTTLLVALTATVLALVFTTFKLHSKSEYSWAGGLSSTSVAFRIKAPVETKRTFVVSTNEDIKNNLFWVSDELFDFNSTVNVITKIISNLESDKRYYYGHIDLNNEVQWNGTFKTPRPEGTKFDFRVATAGCALTGSNSPVFKHIAATNPLMMLHAGDFHYLDHGKASIEERVNGYGRVFEAPNAAFLYSSVPIAYMWDDHDYCGDNQNSDCERRVDARKAYQVGVPHYPLAASMFPNAPEADTDGLLDISPFQAFTIGTIRFILTDLRSEAIVSTPTFEGSIYSEKQKEWLFDELGKASNYDFVVWLTTKPWIGEPSVGGDGWEGYAADREELSTFISENIGSVKGNLLAVSSDIHLVAFDNGSNTDYSSNNQSRSGFPLLHSGPLHNIGSKKKSQFSNGCFTYTLEMNSQFSLLDFALPDNGEPCVSISSYRVDNGKSNMIFNYTLCGNKKFPLDQPNSNSSKVCNPPLFSPTTIVLLCTSIALLVIPTIYAFVVTRRDGRIFVAYSLSLTILAILTAFLIGVAMPIAIYFVGANFFLIETVIVLSFIFAISFVYSVFVVAFAFKFWKYGRKTTSSFTSEQNNSTKELNLPAS